MTASLLERPEPRTPRLAGLTRLGLGRGLARSRSTGAGALPRPNRIGPGARLVIAAVVALAALAAFLLWNIRGNIGFALSLRGATAGAMLVAAFAQAVATVIFHTVTANRILSPSVMGFDRLFVLMQTILVSAFGGQVLADTAGAPRLIIQTLVMVGFATLLYRWLFTSSGGGLYATLLVGVVLGMAFDTISTFLERLLHPTDYDLLSLALFGRITSVDADLLPLSFGVCAVAGVIVWRRRHILDALLLGRDLATNIGVDHRRELTIMLIIVATLVAFSTALVGPLTFFGFLVATLAYQLAGSHRHAYVLPMSVLLGVIALAGGQFIMQHLFYASGFLTVIIEFVGGIVFLAILIGGRKL